MTNILDVFINGVNKGGPMEWPNNTEEILGATGRAQITIQDRTNVYEPQEHDDIKVVIHSNSWVLFHGEVISKTVQLAPGEPYRRWQMDCADYNGEFPQRLVGALDGTEWVDGDGFGDYIMVDNNAQTLATDKLTVQNLLDVYMRVAGLAYETVTYVGEFLPADSFFPLKWLYKDLQEALNQLAALVNLNLQYWGDPDMFFHWTAIPAWQDVAQDIDGTTQGLVNLFPEFDFGTTPLAPTKIDNDSHDPANVVSVSCRGLTFTKDGSSQPQQVYVRGGTGFVYDNGAAPNLFPDHPPEPIPQTANFTLVFNRDTHIYTRTSKGYVGTQSTYTGPFGVTYDVVALSVPRDPVNHTGGPFWLIKTGPSTGKIVPQRTGDGVVTAKAGTYHTYNVSGTPLVVTGLGANLTTGKFSANYILNREYQWPSHTPRPAQAHLLKVISGAHNGTWLHASEVAVVRSPQVTVTKVAPPPPDDTRTPATPVVTIGGSGWVGDHSNLQFGGMYSWHQQDPSLRQAYLDEPNSTSQTDRDSVGGQALYRGKYPTLRGSLVVSAGTDSSGKYHGPDGYRVGQLLHIKDARLPANMNDRWYIIQRVQAKQQPVQDMREYTIDWGDGPVQRSSSLKPKKPPTPPPADGFYIDIAEVQPAPGFTQVVIAQLINGYGQAWAIPDKVVNWKLIALDKDWNTVAGQGLLDPTTSTTDDKGQARTVFTAGDQTGLIYFIYCDSPVISVP